MDYVVNPKIAVKEIYAVLNSTNYFRSTGFKRYSDELFSICKDKIKELKQKKYMP